MHCFNHQDSTAIGTCRQCGKGLCPSCATDLGHGLACRGVHESAVESIDQQRARNRRNSRVASKVASVLPAFSTAMELIYILFGILYYRQDAFTVTMGIGFVAFGVVLFASNRRSLARSKSTTIQN